MDVLDVLQASPMALAGVLFILGAIVGSFLNVVIHRLPSMLEREWRTQCMDLLGSTPKGDAPTEEPFDLVRPRSHCPSCRRPVRAVENIPLLSYAMLRGRCAGCGTRISLRYPVIELIAGLAAAAVALEFGWSLQAGAALIFSWTLIALAGIDWDHQILPDVIQFPLLWLGLLLTLVPVFADPRSAIVGAVAGYLALWSVYHLFRLTTGKEGMGYGDFKLLAALGAWMGWQALPAVILLSAVVGACVGIALIALRRGQRDTPIPFGPYLAGAGWISLLWGDDLMRAYWGLWGL